MKLFLQQTAGSAPKGYAGHANGSIAEGGGEEQLPCIRVRQNISRIDGEGVQQNLYICDFNRKPVTKPDAAVVWAAFPFWNKICPAR